MSTPTTNVEITPKALQEGIYFHTVEYSQFTIECNFCSREDYVFYDGNPDEVHSSDWLTKATNHLAINHQKELKEEEEVE